MRRNEYSMDFSLRFYPFISIVDLPTMIFYRKSFAKYLYYTSGYLNSWRNWPNAFAILDKNFSQNETVFNFFNIHTLTISYSSMTSMLLRNCKLANKLLTGRLPFKWTMFNEQRRV